MRDGMFFKGVSQVTVDPKGRVGVPARYRQTLKESCSGCLIVTADRDGCLLIYPDDAWGKIEPHIHDLPSMNKDARFIQRLMLGYATECELDGQGRILLSSPLREFAHLGKHGLLLGQGKYFELWDQQQWTRQREACMREESDNKEVNQALQSVRL